MSYSRNSGIVYLNNFYDYLNVCFDRKEDIQKFLYALSNVLAELNKPLIQTDLVYSLESKY